MLLSPDRLKRGDKIDFFGQGASPVVQVEPAEHASRDFTITLEDGTTVEVLRHDKIEVDRSA